MSSSEESVVDDDRDADFTLSNLSSPSDTQINDSDEDSERRKINSENIVVDFIDFNDWDDISLDPIPKRKTNSEVWNYFGMLKKDDSIFKPMSKKMFCRPCFDARKFKR